LISPTIPWRLRLDRQECPACRFPKRHCPRQGRPQQDRQGLIWRFLSPSPWKTDVREAGIVLKPDENPPFSWPPEVALSQYSGAWWVAHTRSRNEKALAWHLQTKNIQYFLPMT
jgi:phenylpropionate dioxygenase-like ring-hydroxylating dioxygenase large terminal subunit